MHDILWSLPQNPVEELKAHVRSDRLPVYIYGAGKYAVEVGALLIRNGIEIAGYFVDDTHMGAAHYVDGPILPLSWLSRSQRDFHTVIGFFGDVPSVRSKLASQRIGGKGKHFFIDCNRREAFSAFDVAYVEAHMDHLSRLLELFGEDLSRRTLIEFVRAKITFNAENLVGLVREAQYFPTDIPGFTVSPEDVVVDAGAYTGDTLRDLVKMLPGGRCRAYHAFEVDPRNAWHLGEFVQTAGLDFVTLHQVALGEKNGFAKLQALGGPGSTICESGDTCVPMVTLDSIGLQPTFIKMDIEGSERAALCGSAATITKYRPRLAIAVYHSLEDFVSIPFIVRGLMPGCRLYLRIHRPYTEELVLYAIQ